MTNDRSIFFPKRVKDEFAEIFTSRFVDSIIYGAYLYRCPESCEGNRKTEINVKREILIKFTMYRRAILTTTTFIAFFRRHRLLRCCCCCCCRCENILSLLFLILSAYPAQYSQSLCPFCSHVSLHEHYHQNAQHRHCVWMFLFLDLLFFALALMSFGYLVLAVRSLLFDFIEFTCNDIVTNNTE